MTSDGIVNVFFAQDEQGRNVLRMSRLRGDDIDIFDFDAGHWITLHGYAKTAFAVEPAWQTRECTLNVHMPKHELHRPYVPASTGAEA
jgi:hypothetical protein